MRFRFCLTPFLLTVVMTLNASAQDEEDPEAPIHELHEILIQGKYTAAYDLLKAGGAATGEINSEVSGWTALHTLYLLPPHQFDSNGTSRLQVANLLIDGGVDINGKIEATGTTALHFAAMRGKGGVEELLYLGADATITDVEGIPAEFWAAAARNMEDSERLRVASGNPINVTLPDGTTKADWAAEGWKHLETVRRTIEEEKKEEEKDEENENGDGEDISSSNTEFPFPLEWNHPIRGRSDFCYDEYRDLQRACYSKHQADISLYRGLSKGGIAREERTVA